MASISFNLPDNISWGDYLLDGRQVMVTLEVKKPVEVKTETVHVQKEDAPVSLEVEDPPKVARRMPWCKRGNSCLWSNCKFRHERCIHHDRWTASGCESRGCRSLRYDPLSNKCPADGGCQYDHRDISTLKMFIETVELNNEDDIMDQFSGLGLRHLYDETYDTSQMAKEDKQLLIRSLKAARDDDILQYGEENDDFIIHFLE